MLLVVAATKNDCALFLLQRATIAANLMDRARRLNRVSPRNSTFFGNAIWVITLGFSHPEVGNFCHLLPRYRYQIGIATIYIGGEG